MRRSRKSKTAIGWGVLLAAAAPWTGCGVDADSTTGDDAVVESRQSALTGTWTSLTNAAPANLDTCLLLTNGDVMCHQYSGNQWHRLRPDSLGSYKNGTWNNPPIAPMPNGNDAHMGCANCVYQPLFYASALLKDGRAVVIGGEYNGGGQVETNIGFIYDPVADTWSSQLSEAFGGGNVGDAQSVVLQDGTFMLANINTTNTETLNASTGVFTAKNPTGKLDINSEENWNILADGTVLTVDSRITSSFERYTPSTNTWGNSGSTPVNLADTGAGTPNSKEVGPCAFRPDNKLMCFSGTNLGKNALYDPATNTWSHTASMDFPTAAIGGHYAMPDAPAAALPNGNILVMANPVTSGQVFNAGVKFFELSLATNTLTEVNAAANAASFIAYQGRFLVLPTGEVLLTAFDQSSISTVQLYSNGGAPAASSKPSITSAPAVVSPGGVYSISGTLFNGFSEGASYGDDSQSASNYPLVRITNNATGHVFYARTFNHSRMGIEKTGSVTSVTTSFQVPNNLENGPSTIQVVANGIASPGVAINTKFQTLTLTNGWTAYSSSVGTPAYSVTNGLVQLRGGMKTSGGSTVAFTLPVGARPSATVYAATDLFVANVGRLVIDTAGNVTAQDENAAFVNAPQFTSLDGVSFQVDATGYTALALQNGWTNAPFSTRNAAVKNDNGIVRLQGAIGNGSTEVPFTLPAGFRPSTDTYVPIGLCNALKARLYIQPTGAVTMQFPSGVTLSSAQCFTSLEGVTFAASTAGFTAATLQNSWVNSVFSTRAVRYKNDGGIIRLQGAVGNGTATGIFTLPPEIRPFKTAYVNVDLCGSTRGRVFITSSGVVTVQPQSGSFSDASCFTSLEGVWFGLGQ